MNLAISSVVIFLLVSPGIIARRFYFTRELSRNYVNRNTLQEIFSSIFLAMVIHAIWSNVIKLFGYRVDYLTIFELMYCPDKVTRIDRVIDFAGPIFLYFLSAVLCSGLFAHLTKSYVRIMGLDRRYPPLKYDNKWFYLFNGEILDIEKFKKRYVKDKELPSKNIESRYVDVLTKSEDEIIYTGIIIDFQLSDNSSLDFIVLANPTKFITRDSEGNQYTNPSPKTIPSDYFVIPYSEIQNINVSYLLKPIVDKA